MFLCTRYFLTGTLQLERSLGIGAPGGGTCPRCRCGTTDHQDFGCKYLPSVGPVDRDRDSGAAVDRQTQSGLGGCRRARRTGRVVGGDRAADAGGVTVSRADVRLTVIRTTGSQARELRDCSAGLSPSLGMGIDMAYLPTTLSRIDTALEVDIRGRCFAARVTKKPFYRHPR